MSKLKIRSKSQMLEVLKGIGACQAGIAWLEKVAETGDDAIELLLKGLDVRITGMSVTDWFLATMCCEVPMQHYKGYLGVLGCSSWSILSTALTEVGKNKTCLVLFTEVVTELLLNYSEIQFEVVEDYERKKL